MGLRTTLDEVAEWYWAAREDTKSYYDRGLLRFMMLELLFDAVKTGDQKKIADAVRLVDGTRGPRRLWWGNRKRPPA